MLRSERADRGRVNMAFFWDLLLFLSFWFVLGSLLWWTRR